MDSDDKPATKGDVKEIVTEVVSESTNEILNAMAEEFEKVEATTTRIENRLENVDRKLDDHEVHLEKLEHKA